MSWFRVDDKAAFHRKVLKAGNEAFGAFIRMGCWSSDHLTDGRIPIETASLISTENALQKLCYVGFLQPDGDDFIIHDYLEYNPSASDVKTHRETTRARVERYRKRDGQFGNGVTGSVSNAPVTSAPSRSHPQPIPKEDQKELSSPSAPVSGLDFDKVYALYPRKEGKSAGFRRWKKQVTTQAKYDAWCSAVKNYAAHVAGRAMEHVKQFDSFMSCWEEYANFTPPPKGSNGQKSFGYHAPMPAALETREEKL